MAGEKIYNQQCVSCHREHSGARITAASTGYCVSCHADMKVKDDKIDPPVKFIPA